MNAGANPKAGGQILRNKKKRKEKRKQNVGFISLGVVLAVRPGQHSKINFLFLVPHQISLFVPDTKRKRKKKVPRLIEEKTFLLKS